MVLNKQKGNMYDWITHTWNPVRGRCPHKCTYCYMKRFDVGELRIDDKTLNDKLGKDKVIFVGSSTDMFASAIPSEWIHKVLSVCRENDNTYLFQSKNPGRFLNFLPYFPLKTFLGTTIETDRFYNGYAPTPKRRIDAMKLLSQHGCKTMISIEPIISFNMMPFVKAIRDIGPVFVSIGADSQGHDLDEPGLVKVNALIKELKEFTEVRIKDNLKRLR